MVNKKLSRIMGPVLGIMGFMITMGAVSIPACAAETNISQSAYSNYEINENGIKFKVTDIVGTKHKVKINAVIEGKDVTDLDYRNLQFYIYMNTNENCLKSASWGASGNDKIEIEVENESEEGFSETGNVRADIVMGNYDFNRSITIPVDFTESFKQVMEKEVNAEVSEDVKILKFESDAIGTRIIVYKQSDKDRGIRNFYEDHIKYIFKVDEKIYLIDSRGCDYDENGYIIYENPNLRYNDIKDAKNIGIIQVKSNMTGEEIEDYYKNNDSDFRDNKVVTDNVVYNGEMSFEDGTKGKITVKRTDDKIKLYCSSDSDKKSMLMAVAIDGVYTDGEEYYDSADEPVIYKNTENNNEYIVEFNDKDKGKTFEVFLDGFMLNSDKFELSNEISVK